MYFELVTLGFIPPLVGRYSLPCSVAGDGGGASSLAVRTGWVRFLRLVDGGLHGFWLIGFHGLARTHEDNRYHYGRYVRDLPTYPRHPSVGGSSKTNAHSHINT